MQELVRKRLSRISDNATLKTVIEPGIRARLDLVEEVVAWPGGEVRLLRPRDAEALLSDGAFEDEEFLPYWASVWPSARVLTQVACDRPLAGVRVLELGCGLGVPSIAAALEGAQVLATDWASDAIELLAVNAARNGASLEARRVDWAAPAPLVESAPWPLVIAADVLYEGRNAELLLRLLPPPGAPRRAAARRPGPRRRRPVPGQGRGTVAHRRRGAGGRRKRQAPACEPVSRTRPLGGLELSRESGGDRPDLVVG
jgi:predicted nicotinamide N-methyase